MPINGASCVVRCCRSDVLDPSRWLAVWGQEPRGASVGDAPSQGATTGRGIAGKPLWEGDMRVGETVGDGERASYRWASHFALSAARSSRRFLMSAVCASASFSCSAAWASRPSSVMHRERKSRFSRSKVEV